MWKYWYKFICNDVEFKILAPNQKDAEDKLDIIANYKSHAVCLGIYEED